jgi:hypothetical protein
MTSVRVRLSPGFTNGGEFPAEQFLLWRYSIWQIFSKVYKQCFNPDHDNQENARNNRGIHVVLCLFRIPPEQQPDSLLPGKFPFL